MSTRGHISGLVNVEDFEIVIANADGSITLVPRGVTKKKFCQKILEQFKLMVLISILTTIIF